MGPPNAFTHLNSHISPIMSIVFILLYPSFTTASLFPSNLSARAPNQSTEASIMVRREIPQLEGLIWGVSAHCGTHLSCPPHETPRRDKPIIQELQDLVWNLPLVLAAVFTWSFMVRWKLFLDGFGLAGHIMSGFVLDLNVIYSWIYCRVCWKRLNVVLGNIPRADLLESRILL